MKILTKTMFVLLGVIPSIFLFSQGDNNKVQEQGITSKTHRNNVGKILWADHRILFDIQDNTTYSTEFSSGEAIYGRGYLEHCLYNYSIDLGNGQCLNTTSNYELRINIDGHDMGVFNAGSFPDQNWTTFQINLVLSSGDSEDGINKGVSSKWAKLINSLDKGQHKVSFEFWGGKNDCEKKKYAEGTFTYNKSSDSKVKGSSEEVPQAQMKNAKLEKEMLEICRNQGWKNDTPIDILIIESDWRIVRDGWGNITDREINTYVVLKNSNGLCKANDISFRQPYNGKSYGKTQLYGLGMKSISVDCGDYIK